MLYLKTGLLGEIGFTYCFNCFGDVKLNFFFDLLLIVVGDISVKILTGIV